MQSVVYVFVCVSAVFVDLGNRTLSNVVTFLARE